MLSLIFRYLLLLISLPAWLITHLQLLMLPLSSGDTQKKPGLFCLVGSTARVGIFQAVPERRGGTGTSALSQPRGSHLCHLDFSV